MKLKELLKVVPDNYRVGLMDSDQDSYSLMVFGDKKSVIFGYSHRSRLQPEQVENMTVVSIRPGATARIPDDTTMYGDDSVELHVKTHLLIEASIEGEEYND